MPRQLRIEYPGAFYHLMARGDRREDIFLDDTDHEMMLRTLAQACAKTGWRVHGWVLMSNHYHWLVETPKANLVEGMRWLQNTYTRRFNQRHKMWGHLFGGRYKAVLVENDGDQDYLANLLDYIHLNPVRAGLVDSERGLGLLSYRWSSLSQVYAVSPRRRPKWCVAKRGFAAFGWEDNAAGRRELIEHLERRVIEEKAQECGWRTRGGQSLNSTLRRGWYWGSQVFREQLLERAAEPLGRAANRNLRSSHQGHDHAEVSAQALIRRGLEELRLTEQQLKASCGSETHKVALAWAVARSTTMNQSWIAERLCMSSAANVSQQIRRFEANLNRPKDRRLRDWIRSVMAGAL